MKTKGWLRRWLNKSLVWYGLWDGLCALAEGTRTALRQLLRLPPTAPRVPRSTWKKKLSYYPIFERLELRQLMSVVTFSSGTYTVNEYTSSINITVQLDQAPGSTL